MRCEGFELDLLSDQTPAVESLNLEEMNLVIVACRCAAVTSRNEGLHEQADKFSDVADKASRIRDRIEQK